MVRLTSQELLDKSRGIVLGAAIGDALGMPLEYTSKRDVAKYFGGRVTSFVKPSGEHPCRHLQAGNYTDDTQQLIALAESLTDEFGFSIDDFGRKLAGWYQRNIAEPNFKRYPGGTSMDACRLLSEGVSPRISGSETARTCGSAMRAAPIGIFYNNDPETARNYGRESSIPTHNSQITREAAGFVAETVACLINNMDPREAVERATSNLSSGDLQEVIAKVIENINTDPGLIRDFLGGSSECVLEAVPFATYVFLRNPSDFNKAVIDAANDSVPGDTDSIACITGAFAGALHGAKNISQKSLEGIENRVYLEGIAKNLATRSRDGKAVFYQHSGDNGLNYEDLSRFVGNLSRNVNVCIEENGFRRLGQGTSLTCSHHYYQNSDGARVALRTKLSRNPLGARVMLTGDTTEVNVIRELVKKKFS